MIAGKLCPKGHESLHTTGSSFYVRCSECKKEYLASRCKWRPKKRTKEYVGQQDMFGGIDMPNHDGKTYEPARDKVRLNKQQVRIVRVMQDGEWHTLSEMSDKTGDPEASVSARIRDLRKEKFGGHSVVREYVGKGLWRYRMVVP